MKLRQFPQIVLVIIRPLHYSKTFSAGLLATDLQRQGGKHEVGDAAEQCLGWGSGLGISGGLACGAAELQVLKPDIFNLDLQT